MNPTPVFIISGNQGQGKTTLLLEVIENLRRRGMSLAGFAAEGSWQGAQRHGFHLRDLNSGERQVLCTADFRERLEKLGRFYFDRQTIRWGVQLLKEGLQKEAKLFVIDEMGKFEMQGKVWHDVFLSLYKSRNPLLVTVRSTWVKSFSVQFGIDRPVIFTVGQSAEDIADEMIHLMA
jgi:nucleoside-triphosphatase